MFGKVSNSVELGCQYLKDYIQADPSLLRFRRLMETAIDLEVFEQILKDGDFKIEFEDVDCLADAVLEMYTASLSAWNCVPGCSAELEKQLVKLEKIKLLTEYDLIPNWLYTAKFFERIWLEWDYRMHSNLRKYARVWQNIYYMAHGDEGLIFE
jgi:hypothetical protein